MSEIFRTDIAENSRTLRAVYSTPVCIVSTFDLDQSLMFSKGFGSVYHGEYTGDNNHDDSEGGDY